MKQTQFWLRTTSHDLLHLERAPQRHQYCPLGWYLPPSTTGLNQWARNNIHLAILRRLLDRAPILKFHNWVQKLATWHLTHLILIKRQCFLPQAEEHKSVTFRLLFIWRWIFTILSISIADPLCSIGIHDSVSNLHLVINWSWWVGYLVQLESADIEGATVSRTQHYKNIFFILSLIQELILFLDRTMILSRHSKCRMYRIWECHNTVQAWCRPSTWIN